MKSALCRCVAGVVLVALPAAAEAKGITYDCDTAASHFSELTLPTDGVPFTVSGNVQLRALAESDTYMPLARVQIASSATPGNSADVFAGFSLGALPANAKKKRSGSSAVQMLSYNVNGKEDEVLPLSVTTEAGTVQPFSLSYDGSSVLVKLAGESKSFALKTAEPVVRLVCSTGEFLFTDLTITSSR